MKICHRQKNRGFAVIIALVAVTVLTLLAGAFAYAMKIEIRLAANTNDDEKFYWIGPRRRGARVLVAGAGRQPAVQFQAAILGPRPRRRPGNQRSARRANRWTISIGEGTVSLTITELESKININTADGPLIQQVLTAMGADANDISVVSDSILDWIEPGDNATRPAGAKSDYYLGHVPSYYRQECAPSTSWRSCCWSKA